MLFCHKKDKAVPKRIGKVLLFAFMLTFLSFELNIAGADHPRRWKVVDKGSTVRFIYQRFPCKDKALHPKGARFPSLFVPTQKKVDGKGTDGAGTFICVSSQKEFICNQLTLSIRTEPAFYKLSHLNLSSYPRGPPCTL